MMQPDEKWVEMAVRAMRNSSTYQSVVNDEWYEALPVPIVQEDSLRLLIAFGRNKATSQSNRPVLDRRPLQPHLLCLISYPNGQLTWRQSSNSENKDFLEQDTRKLRPGSLEPMKDRRSYYRALSRFLKSGAMLRPVNQITAEDCTLAKSVRELLFVAANPWLDSFYESAIQPLDRWASHCYPRTP